ncbi:hypothetical protein HGM15179_004070 [Zosterops borbonicus]|uniref:Uncharacterized protein n=1 Tax=Zosterops borbonicus TaxID=364589 RepID=A0A8K1GPV6_9PASS|nr:hypothetical protein HGM15179_004070 [Zosterops borbonicus]
MTLEQEQADLSVATAARSAIPEESCSETDWEGGKSHMEPRFDGISQSGEVYMVPDPDAVSLLGLVIAHPESLSGLRAAQTERRHSALPSSQQDERAKHEAEADDGVCCKRRGSAYKNATIVSVHEGREEGQLGQGLQPKSKSSFAARYCHEMDGKRLGALGRLQSTHQPCNSKAGGFENPCKGVKRKDEKETQKENPKEKLKGVFSTPNTSSGNEESAWLHAELPRIILR